jgi:hypothetical protein
MPRFVAHIANLLVQGEDRTTYPDGSWQRNRTCFTLGGFEFVLLRTRESFSLRPSQLKGRFSYTHDLVVEDLDPADLSKVERIVQEITELLSFATQSQVVRFAQDFPGATWRRPVRGVSLFSRPAFNQGEEIRRFLEQSWRTYRRLRHRRNLHVVIGYLTIAEELQVVEVQLLAVFAVLESLKSTYAAEAGCKYCKPAWRRPSTPPKPKLKNEPTVSFEKLLREMFAKVKMRPHLRRLVELRNDIVHNGVSRRHHDSQFAAYELAQGLVREYLLRLLGYSGRYYDYPSRTMRTT